MNREALRDLVEQKSGAAPASFSEFALAPIRDLLGAHPDVDEYIRYCLPQTSFQASRVGVLGLYDIIGEMHPEAGPGGPIRPFGYVVVGSSAGGNALCFHCPSGRVFWADHESFAQGSIIIENRLTGELEELSEYTPENVERALVPLSHHIEPFLMSLLTDQLGDQLDELD